MGGNVVKARGPEKTRKSTAPVNAKGYSLRKGTAPPQGTRTIPPARAQRENIAFRFCIITDLLQNTGTIYEENKRKHTSIGEGRSLKH